MPERPSLILREFRDGDAEAFRRLNEEWITRYFRMEPKDEKTFADPKATILDAGGRILLATFAEDGKEDYAGCCALLAMGGGTFEVAKMAVSPRHQGQGIGGRLLRAAIEVARDAGARRLYLETNHILTPAIRLYESVGFRHLDPAAVPPSPYARADVHMELLLPLGAPGSSQIV
jgi:putative acetyltransferase